ncbi:YHS domain-containing (seleno)protein [Flavobacterium sp.]|uniref:YHS domain-containing (seleno)protein n=1 Tax=Flavobacterium sp. TaxID=239 RepID=UPI002B4AB89C|nr:YHS domain-containing (seleno)protein [Flavobacterium sp.]HLP64959.1 YHS domain-containing (seleno)protein [Flavobacterium sp.]
MKKIIFILIALLSITTQAQKSTEYNQEKGIALQGFDPVAYFETAKALKGTKEFSVTHNGVVYQFSSEKNKTLFLSNPIQYEPQYGGYCAYGMSNGYKAPIEPEAFTIVDGKLYLNYNLKVKEMWLKEQSARIEKANKNWEEVKKS